MIKITILGARGFIGKNLYTNFLSDGTYSLKGYSSKECNLLSQLSINKVLSSLTENNVVIFTSSITRLQEDSFESMMRNIHMAENVSQFFKKHKIRQLIYLSTIDVYGNLQDNVQISEKLVPNPSSYYGTSKLASEFILKNSCSRYNIPLFILRLPGIYGHGDKRKSTIGKLVDSALKGKINIFGDGKDKRDFVYVDDLYRIIKITIEKNFNTILNIATGRSYSINEIVDIIKSNIHDFKIEYKNEIGEKKGDRVFNISFFKKLFPNFKFIDIREGVSLYINNIH